MKNTRTKFATARLLYNPPKAGGGWFFFPSQAEGKNHPRPLVEIAAFDSLCDCLGAQRLQTTIVNNCPGLTAASGQIGTVLARLWGSDMRCKNRAKRVFTGKSFYFANYSGGLRSLES